MAHRRALLAIALLALVAALPELAPRSLTSAGAVSELDVRSRAQNAPFLGALAGALDERITSFSGSAGVVVFDPRAGVLYERNADELVPTASLYKLGVLLEAERRVEAGELRYDEPVEITDEDLVEGDLFALPDSLTVDAALEWMIGASSNVAAQALLRRFGSERVNRTLERAGISPFRVEPDEYVASPRAVARFFAALARGSLLSRAASARMLERLTRQRIADRLPAGLPAGTRVAHKTGNLGYATHDAGIVFTSAGRPIVVVVMTWDSGEAEAVELIRDVAARVYRAYEDPKPRLP